jgi:transposase InsO family protein
VCHLISLKSAWPNWGPKKLCVLYGEWRGQALSVSTCHRVLKAAGLIKGHKVRVRHAAAVLVGTVIPREPNDVWTIDFKGWWRAGDGSRCEPLTVRDAFSRFVLSAHLPPTARSEDLAKEFHRLFQQYGLPKVIKSDNGSPFASPRAPLGLSKLSAEWVAMGIQLEHSRPGHPQDNGGHERLHRDIEAEVAAHVQVDVATQQRALDLWRHDHNEIRPHECLAGQRPAQVYQRSPRVPPVGPLTLDYGAGYAPRLVSTSGVIRFRGKLIFVSTALAGWHVALRLQPNRRAEVWFNYLLIGTINLQTNRFDSAPSRSVKPVGLAA